ncbi:MAG: metallophosphoesterase family protein [Eubacteriales bacterium]|nr:metallophosphoesterase family protein [Eubacteriales bacterium]
MRIGVISDIHSNIVALNAVLRALNAANCEQLICCGDIIGIGPRPEETVQRVMQIPNLTAIRGNHENYLLEGMPTRFPNDEHMTYEEIVHHQWEHALLSPSSVGFLKGLPSRTDFSLCGLHIVAVHYAMDGLTRYIRCIPQPTLEDCRQLFSGIDADVVLYGHDHRASIHQDSQRLFANFGSLGCPALDGNVARAGILALGNGEATAEQILVPYDVDSVLADIDRLAYPASDKVKLFFYGQE